MSKWQDKSDFEINRAVAKVRNLNWSVSAVDDDNVVVLYGCELFDPCNNPNDAWPIILKCKISTFPTGLNSDLWQAEHYFCKTVRDKNPLRAAMIVYLEWVNCR